jgi:hypothetical protein
MAERKTAASKAEERGYLGVPVDPTDKHAYTVPGVLAGEPTPETDADHARTVRQKLDDEARAR